MAAEAAPTSPVSRAWEPARLVRLLCEVQNENCWLLVNLLDNAIKYTEQGQIDLGAMQDIVGLRITIADTGIGIPAENLPHIFDRFYRVDTSRSARGSGLGLAIALDIARAHGGTIDVSSAISVRTILGMSLPC